MNLANLLDNRTPMAARCLPMEDRHGEDRMVIVAKMTWEVSKTGTVQVAYPQTPLRSADKPASDEIYSSVKYPGDLVDEKPGTDLLLVGTAYPPPGKAVTEMTAGLRMETGDQRISKSVTVHGARVYYQAMLGKVTPGPPAQLSPTPLLYELAYGGAEDADPTDMVIFRRNPSGIGHAKDRAKLVNAPAPQLEDPIAPLSDPVPAPAGFGPIAASWLPRVSFAGTYDMEWRRNRAPARPLDFDPKFNRVAPTDLQTDQPLRGDEPIETLGVTPEGIWRFRLPRYAPVFTASIRGIETVLPTHLDTYLVDADNALVELSWRASFPLPKRVGYIDRIVLTGDPPLSDELVEDLRARVDAAAR